MTTFLYFLMLFHILTPSAIPQALVTTANRSGTVFSVVSPANTAMNCVGTFPCTLSYSPSAGNALRVDVYLADNGAGYTISVADDASGGSSTYTQIFQHTDAITGFNASAAQFVALNVKAAANITVSISGSGATHIGGFNLVEYHRTSGSWATDQSSALTTFSSVTSQSCTAITTTGTPSMAMYWILNQDDATHGFTGASSYTNEANNGLSTNGNVLGSGDLIQTSPGSTTPATTTLAAVSGSCYSSSIK